MFEKQKNEITFSIQQKSHKMSPRKGEKFQINFANTDRLINSPVTYMQKLLNENENNQK